MEINESVKQEITSVLGNIPNNIEISLVKGTENETECQEVEALFNSMATILPRLSVKIYDVNSDFAQKNGIQRTPAFMVHAPEETSSYVYYGVPASYEFSTLIEAIRTVGNRMTDLSDTLKDQVKSIKKELKMDIFVTPTCSFCPGVVISAFRCAYENQNIKVKIIEGTHFSDLVQEKGIRSVPRGFINGASAIQGSIGIEDFVKTLINI